MIHVLRVVGIDCRYDVVAVSLQTEKTCMGASDLAANAFNAGGATPVSTRSKRCASLVASTEQEAC